MVCACVYTCVQLSVGLLLTFSLLYIQNVISFYFPTPSVPKPKITVHPQSKKVLYGNSFELSIQLESSRYSEYQWYKNHKLLGGKIHPQIYINSAVDSDSGDYYCVVKNEVGSVTSNTATIEVIVSSSRQPVPSGPTLYARSSGPVGQPWSSSGCGSSSIKTNSRLYTGLIERGLPSCVETAEQSVVEGKSGSVFGRLSLFLWDEEGGFYIGSSRGCLCIHKRNSV